MRGAAGAGPLCTQMATLSLSVYVQKCVLVWVRAQDERRRRQTDALSSSHSCRWQLTRKARPENLEWNSPRKFTSLRTCFESDRSTGQAPGSLSLSLALSSHSLNRPPVLNFLGEFHLSLPANVPNTCCSPAHHFSSLAALVQGEDGDCRWSPAVWGKRPPILFFIPVYCVLAVQIDLLLYHARRQNGLSPTIM